MKKLRKFLTIGVMVLSVIAMSGIVVAPVNASASTGDLIKMSGNSSVYYLAANGKRYVFPNSTTYFSWYPDFSGVVTIPASELQSYPLGGNITMRAGTKLVKVTTDPSVYAVEPNGTLRKIQSEAQAAALYGTNWNKRVVDVPDAFFTNYTTGTALTNGATPVGSLVKTAGSSSVYYYDGTNYRMFASEAALTANRFNMSDVLTVASVTAGGASIAAADSTLVNTAQGGTSTGTVVTGSGLMVSLNSNTAVAATVITNQALADLASFNLTAANDGAVTVKSMKLKRTGVSSDSSLSNVYLYEGTTKLTDNASLSNGYVTFSNASGIVTISAGSTKTITVKGDVAGTTGNIGMAINAASDLTTTASAVTGSFPLSGNLMSMTQATDLATVGIQAITSAGANINAGTMNATLWSAPFRVAQKAVDMKSISFKQVGSIPTDSIQNLTLYVNGVKVGDATSITSDNRVNFTLATPSRLATGDTTVELRGDIVKGSDRTFSFAVQTASDVVLTDTNYNVNVAVTAGGGLNSSASTTINSGSVSIATDANFTTTEVVKTASNATLAKYTFKAFGENVKVNSLRVTPTLTGGANGEKINELAIFVNGGQVGSSQTWTFQAGGSKDFGTSNLFTIEAGQTVTVEIRGSLDLLSNTSATSVKTDLVVVANKLEGVTSFKTTPAGDTTYGGRDLSVVAGSLTVAANSGLQNQSVAKNTNAVKIGSYTLKAGSSEGARITNLRVDVTGTAALTNLSNLYISENTTPVLPQAQNNFPVNFTLSANQTKTIDVYVDLGDVANNETVITDLTVTGVSTPSNTSLSYADIAGQTMTARTGTIADPTLVSNAPVAKLVVGGATNETVATYKFVASNSTVKVDEIKFKVTKTDGSTANGTAIQSLTVNGITAPAVLTSGAYVVDLNGLNLSVPAGTQGLNVEVKANFNTVTSANQGGSATNNDTKIVLTEYKYIVGNTTTIDNNNGGGANTLAVASNQMSLVAGAPVVVDVTPSGLSRTLVAGGNNEVMRFSVTAQNSVINLKQVALSARSSYALTNAKAWIYDADDMNTALNGAGGTALADGNFAQAGTKTLVPFTNDYTINAGTTKTFVVKVDNSGTIASGDYFRTDLTSSDGFAVAHATNGDWRWNDGTIALYVNGFLVKNLPITGATFTKN